MRYQRYQHRNLLDKISDVYDAAVSKGPEVLIGVIAAAGIFLAARIYSESTETRAQIEELRTYPANSAYSTLAPLESIVDVSENQ